MKLAKYYITLRRKRSFYQEGKKAWKEYTYKQRIGQLLFTIA